MKKLLLDTTYLLPLVGIAIDGIDAKLVQKILSSKEYSIQISEISLFELAAKGAKIANQADLTYQDVLKGLDTIRFEKRFEIISWISNPLILELSYKLRTLHADYIDCLIIATAICSAEIIATYDNELLNIIIRERKIIDEIKRINQEFRVWFEDLGEKSILIEEIEKRNRRK